MLFASLIPHTQVIEDSGGETTFCDAEKEAGSQESGEILGDTHEHANDTPCEGESREPKLRCGEFEDDVARDLEQDVTDKVDRQCSQVLVPGLFQTVVRMISVVYTGEKVRTHV